MFKLIGNLVPEVGEIVRLEGTLDDVFFFIVIAEEGRVVGLVLDIAVTRWDEVATLRPLSLVFTPTGCHCNELYTYNHRNIKKEGQVRPSLLQLSLVKVPTVLRPTRPCRHELEVLFLMLIREQSSVVLSGSLRA